MIENPEQSALDNHKNPFSGKIEDMEAYNEFLDKLITVNDTLIENLVKNHNEIALS